MLTYVIAGIVMYHRLYSEIKVLKFTMCVVILKYYSLLKTVDNIISRNTISRTQDRRPLYPSSIGNRKTPLKANPIPAEIFCPYEIM
jgi:hypothetical protein